MREHRSLAAGQYGGEHAPLPADSSMANGESAAKEGLEISGSRSVAYFVVT